MGDVHVKDMMLLRARGWSDHKPEDRYETKGIAMDD